MKNPYDPPTIYNCHNTLREAFNDGVAARDKWWIEQIEKYKAGGFGSFDADEGDVLLYGFRWKQLKERTNGNSNKRL